MSNTHTDTGGTNTGAPDTGPANSGPTNTGAPDPPASHRRRRPLNWVIGWSCVALIVAIAVLSWIWLPHDPSAVSSARLAGPSLHHLFGTDTLGRDLASRTMLGARIAIGVGVASVAIGAVVGVLLGLLSALASGWIDDTVAGFLDIVIAFPALLLAMILVAATSASLTTVIVAIGLAMSGLIARLTRILAKQVIDSDYAVAARLAGAGQVRVILDHVLPNIWPMLAVNFALELGRAAIAEATLSFLGLGSPPPNPSWGTLLHEAQTTAVTNPMAAIAPGVLLVIFVVGTNLVADGIRDRVDTSSERQA